jgi:aldose 1-epimerase
VTEGPGDPALPTGRQHEIQHGDQVAIVGEVGATLRGFSAGGVDVIDGFPADEPSTAGRGQVLAPWPNRLDGGRYVFDGVEGTAALDEPELDNAIHGLVRWQPWRAIAQDDRSVRLGCVLHPQPAYPWSLELEVEYRLEDDGLHVTGQASNASAAACPFGLGFHPYLTVGEPLVDSARLRIGAKRRLVCNERGLPEGDEVVEGTVHDFTELRRIADTKLDTAFTGLATDPEGRACAELRSDSGRGVTLWAGPEFPYLMVYTGDALAPESRRRKGIAIEPMTCPPNALRTGTDLVRLEPGATWTGSWGISPWPP